MTGRVIKAVGGKFLVVGCARRANQEGMPPQTFYNDSLCAQNATIIEGGAVVCHGRGKTKKQADIIVGDLVDYSVNGNEGVIEKILPRENNITRPLVANISQIVLVIAPLPEPDMVLVDKMIVMARMLEVEIALCVNKQDMAISDRISSYIKSVYSEIFDKIVFTSSQTGFGMEEFRELLSGGVSCICGQSAVGKSSLINEITDFALEIGGLTEKTKRGKHTTRHAVLLPVGKGYIVDTPGFSLLNLQDLRFDELYVYYDDYIKLQQQCRYKTCTHTTEPDCAVKDAVDNCRADKGRYVRYTNIFNELKEQAEF